MEVVCCPDCDEIVGGILDSSIGGKGNGKCHYCHGLGYTIEIVDRITRVLSAGFSKSLTPCIRCNTRGRCTTCFGDGVITIYDSRSDIQKETSKKTSDFSDKQERQPTSNGEMSSGGGGGESSGCSSVFYFLLIIIFAPILKECASQIKHDLTPRKKTYYRTPPKQVVDKFVPIVTAEEIDTVSFPDVETIQKDLIGREVLNWKFTRYDDFRAAEILSREVSNGKVLQKMYFLIFNSNEKIHYEISIEATFRLTSEGNWKLTYVRQIPYPRNGEIEFEYPNETKVIDDIKLYLSVGWHFKDYSDLNSIDIIQELRQDYDLFSLVEVFVSNDSITLTSKIRIHYVLNKQGSWAWEFRKIDVLTTPEIWLKGLSEVNTESL